MPTIHKHTGLSTAALESAGPHTFLVGTGQTVCKTLNKQHIVEHFNTGHRYQSRLDALQHTRPVLRGEEE